jgi:hypothetical protein
MASGVLTEALKAHIDGHAVATTVFKIGETSVKVGCKPLTPADFNFVNSKLARDAKGRSFTPFQQDPTNFDGQIAMLVRKCRVVDEDGNIGEKAFTMNDANLLGMMGVEIVSKWFADLFGPQLSIDPDEDEAAKN